MGHQLAVLKPEISAGERRLHAWVKVLTTDHAIRVEIYDVNKCYRCKGSRQTCTDPFSTLLTNVSEVILLYKNYS